MVSLFAHLGLGDTILLSGAVAHLALRHGAVRVYCYPHYFKSVSSFFAANPRVRVIALKERPGGWYGIPPEKAFREVSTITDKVLRCGVYAGPFGERLDTSFPELFYRQLGVPYAERWNACPLEKAAESVPQLAPSAKIFVHDDPARGYHINKAINSRSVYRPVAGHSLLAFCKILRGAEEIHVIDSAFFHLIESLSGITAALYFHRYSRKYVRGWNDYPKRYSWVTLP